MVFRVIYEIKPVRSRSAFSYIDNGFIQGYKQAGAQVVAWNSRDNRPNLLDLLETFRPTHFLPNLQGMSWDQPNSWATGDLWKTLLSYKAKRGLFVGVRSGPSNIQDLFLDAPIDFHNFPDKGVVNFYQQPEKPTEIEKNIIESEFIDVIRSPLSKSIYKTAFRNFINLGLPILEEPHAACSSTYFRFLPKFLESNTLVYIGGCWPFKLANMEPYIEALQKRFGKKFKLYGSGWPKHYGVTPIPETLFNLALQKSAICIALHEPTQVLNFPFSSNERPFKLMAMGCCVVSDSNPWLKELFDDSYDIVITKNPEDMIDRINDLLSDSGKRLKIAQSGQRKVFQSHTYLVRAKRLLEISAQASLPAIIPYA